MAEAIDILDYDASPAERLVPLLIQAKQERTLPVKTLARFVVSV